MTLLDLRVRYGHFFCPQDWYLTQEFARRPAGTMILPPKQSVPRLPAPDDLLPHAVDLARAYVESPKNPVWRGYLWCADVDHEGQRVYVGGLANGRGFEIHRHLIITDRWGTPTWL